jgi:hypothetical protein
MATSNGDITAMTETSRELPFLAKGELKGNGRIRARDSLPGAFLPVSDAFVAGVQATITHRGQLYTNFNLLQEVAQQRKATENLVHDIISLHSH